MRYDQVREQIKSGDMLLWSAQGGWGSRHDIETKLVKMGTESQWTHVGVAWVERGRVFVMDLTTRGCAPRPLSGDLPCYWIPAPRELSEQALQYAFSRFGEMTYSRWQAFKAAFGKLAIGRDLVGECAEYAIEIWRMDGLHPTVVATPGGCMEGALANWEGAQLHFIDKVPYE
jgi:hypothetical protein